jgi:hypothetical protein
LSGQERNPKGLPRALFCGNKINRRKFFNVDEHWICNYPHMGETNILELKDRKDKPL